MALSLKKYLLSSLKFFIPFLIVILSCIGVNFIESVDAGIFSAIIIPISTMVLLLPSGYHFIMFLLFRKKCKAFKSEEAVVFNWEASFFRYSGSIIIKVDNTEYSSSAYFTHEECKELVGKTIYYAIIQAVWLI